MGWRALPRKGANSLQANSHKTHITPNARGVESHAVRRLDI